MKKNTLLLISWVLGICEIGILLFIISVLIYSSKNAGSFSESFGISVMFAIFYSVLISALPIHVIAIVFNIVAWKTSNKMIALVASILYLIEGVIVITFVVPPLLLLANAILCFIAFIKMKQVNNISVDNNSEAISNNESDNNKGTN